MIRVARIGAFHGLNRLAPGWHHIGPQSESAEGVAENLARLCVIVDDQGADSRQIGNKTLLLLFGADAKPGREPERAPPSGFALGPDLAAHHLDQTFADRQPEAGTAVLARRRCVGLRESLE